jgi:hypothetical protein
LFPSGLRRRWYDGNPTPCELSSIEATQEWASVFRPFAAADGECPISDVVLEVFQGVIIKMAGRAAEELLCDGPLEALCDRLTAQVLASTICTSPASIEAFLAFANVEAKALVRKYRGAVEAIADALVEKQTLNDAAEINELIATGLSRQQLAEERHRRERWREIIALAVRI